LNQTKERKYKNKNKICFDKKKKEKRKGKGKKEKFDTRHIFRFKIVYWYHSSFGFQTKQVFIFILF